MSVEFLDHTADVAVRIAGKDWPEFFREAVRAIHLIWLGEEGVREVRLLQEVPLHLEAGDGETLLVDLLNELIYLLECKKWLLPALEVKTFSLDGAACRLQGRLRGEPFDPKRHLLRTEIKSATFHDLEIRRAEGALAADVVFDL